MKDLFIVANWKANKTEEEAIYWLSEFRNNLDSLKGQFENKELILCPSYPVISAVKNYIDKFELPITLGSQDVSQFGRGAYTGEVPVSILKKYVRFCIIGHSERRENFQENDEILSRKVSTAIAGGLLPIFCVQGKNTFIPLGVKIVAYEPKDAIGTGNPDTPQNADEVAAAIKSKQKEVTSVLYGGSVNAENVGVFTEMEHIDGVLVGGGSLDSNSFISLLQKC